MYHQHNRDICLSPRLRPQRDPRSWLGYFLSLLLLPDVSCVVHVLDSNEVSGPGGVILMIVWLYTSQDLQRYMRISLYLY